ncbi:hypothetical protein C2845_PM02G14700 [Panicum miliaceum]|uniref:Uncharacterized protein n=1 Tax=Panicum miliaceum TaxID=4540 RepID=A0A3L6S7B2_PANMI|nr:hypothetical protein C2845_PM02G14700 [Panicum miliaceum]
MGIKWVPQKITNKIKKVLLFPLYHLRWAHEEPAECRLCPLPPEHESIFPNQRLTRERKDLAQREDEQRVCSSGGAVVCGCRPPLPPPPPPPPPPPRQEAPWKCAATQSNARAPNADLALPLSERPPPRRPP